MTQQISRNEDMGEDRFGLLKTALRWGVPAILLLISLVLGYLGFREHAITHGVDRSLLDLIYLSFQLFTLESGGVEPPVPWTLEVARWAAPTLPVFAAILGLFKLLRRFFHSERVRLYRDHVIICGAGLKGMALARNLILDDRKVVVIERDPNNLNLPKLERLGIPVFIGDATTPQILGRARIKKARHLVALCREDQTNVSVAVAARSLWSNCNEGAITCHIDVENREACRALIEKELHDSETPRCWLEFHKSDDVAAESLLRNQAKIFDGRNGITPPHILFVGLDSMARSLLLKAARMWSEIAESDEFKLRYSIIGEGIEETLASTLDRHPPLDRWAKRDDSLLAATSLEELREIHRPDESFADSDSSGPLHFDLVFICAAADAETLSTALKTHRFLRDIAPDTPILVPTYENAGFRRFLPGADDDCSYYRAISVVSIPETSFTADFIEKGVIEEMAQWIHHFYNLDFDVGKDDPAAARKTKANLKDWLLIPEDSRMSNYAQARRIFDYFVNMGFRIDPSRQWDFEPLTLDDNLIDKLAMAEHDRWMEERISQGWRPEPETFMEKARDRIPPLRRKRHNCLVPWDQLDADEQMTDIKIVKRWPTVLKMVGFRIRQGNATPCD